MSDMVVDSCVVAKWVLPELDTDKALRLIAQAESAGDRLMVADIALPEVANAIWKRQRRGLATREEAQRLVDVIGRFPVRLQPSAPLLTAAFEMAVKYDRSVYDALFVALSVKLGVRGVTADEPLHNAVHADFPQIVLLRNL